MYVCQAGKRGRPRKRSERDAGLGAGVGVAEAAGGRRTSSGLRGLGDGPAIGLFLGASRAASAQKRRADALVESARPVHDKWNKDVVRVGDTIGDAPELNGLHPNCYLPRGVLTMAWRRVGKNTLERSGIEGSTRHLSALISVAQAAYSVSRACARGFVDGFVHKRACPVITRLYDCTPHRMRFSALVQEKQQQAARYAIVDSVTGKWKLVPYSEWARQFPRLAPQWGVLECLVQGIMVVFENEDSTMCAWEDLCRGCVLSRGNASCLLRGTELSAPEFSRASLQELCSKVPYLLYQEVPDAHSANGRKKAKTFASLPDNAFGINTKCLAHQGHRIISSREPGVIGDIYASYVTCSNVNNRKNIEREFWNLIVADLRNGGYMIARPDAQDLARNKWIIKNTLFDRTGSDLDAQDAELVLNEDPDHPCSLFWRTWHGNWLLPRIEYRDDSGALGLEGAARAMYSSALAVDLMMGKDSTRPCVDDWGSCGMAGNRLALGWLCHRAMQRVLPNVFTDWQTMLPPAPADAIDQGSAQREIIRKKTWRTKKVFESVDRMVHVLVFVFVGAHVQQLILSLQHLDERPSALLDVMFDDDLNPVHQAQIGLSGLLVPLAAAPLRHLYEFIESCSAAGEAVSVASFHQRCCDVALDMSGQLWWRFRFLKEYPHRWAVLQHPRVDHDKRVRCAVEFFELRSLSCCRTWEFCDKVWKIFWDGNPTTSAWRLLGDVDFQRMLRSWVRRGFKLCNMKMERLLALVNRACGSDMPDSERFVAMSLLSQMMKAHRTLGRTDPVVTSRAELLKDGVPIRAGCKPAKCQRRGDGGGVIAYVNQKHQERISAGVSMNLAECWEFSRICGEKFASMSKDEQKPFAAKASLALAERDVEEETMPDNVPGTDVCHWHNFVRDIGGEKDPLSFDCFRLEISRVLGLDPEDDRIRGIDSYSQAFRREAVDASFIEDAGDIPSDEEFTYEVPCSIMHPGFCATADSEVLEKAAVAVRGLQRYTAKQHVGSYFVLCFISTSSVTRMIIRLGHKRGGNPRLTLITRAHPAGCGVTDDGCCVSLEVSEESVGSVRHQISNCFFARVFQDIPEVNTIECRRKARGCCAICGFDKTADDADMQAEQIYPQVRQPQRSVAERALRKKELQLSSGLQSCKVKIKAPRPQKPSKKQAKPDYTSGSDSSVSAEESDASIRVGHNHVGAAGEGQNGDPGDAGVGEKNIHTCMHTYIHSYLVGDVGGGQNGDAGGDAGDAGAGDVGGGQNGDAGADAGDTYNGDHGQEVGGVITWTVPGYGELKYSVASQLLAAHCCLGGSERLGGIALPREHGPGACRLNRSMAKAPIGMLVRWLQVQRDYDGRDAHFKARSATKRGGDLDYDRRVVSRLWLRSLAGMSALFELEAHARGESGDGKKNIHAYIRTYIHTCILYRRSC